MRKSKYKRNILKVFNQATSQEITNGVYWYDEAAKVAKDISEAFDIPFERTCLVISALSPNNSWTRNISDAWKVCRTWYELRRKPFLTIVEYEKAKERCVTCTYPANKQKAFDILDGKLDYLNGLKTQNFARNIAGCQQSVTIDVHAFSVAEGKRYTAKTIKPISPKVYEECSGAYKDVAREMDVAPAHLQAIVWQTWRRLHGLTTHQEITGRLF